MSTLNLASTREHRLSAVGGGARSLLPSTVTMIPLMPRGVFRVGVRVSGSNVGTMMVSPLKLQQQQHQHQVQPQQQQTRGTKKIAAVIMGAPGNRLPALLRYSARVCLDSEWFVFLVSPLLSLY